MKTQKFDKSFSNVEETTKNIDFESLLDCVTQSEINSRDFIAESINSNLDPTSDEVQHFNLRSKTMRRIGQKFLNLFRITFTVEFAGVMLINFTIPKLNGDEK